MRHGTVTGYNYHRCRCDLCKAAIHERSVLRGNTGSTHDGRLAAACWCEHGFVLVTPADVLNGRTGSCGRPDCARLKERVA